MPGTIRFENQWGETYTFPTEGGDQDYRDNFREVRAAVSRVAGASGGVDEFGVGRAPKATGSIQFGIVLWSETREGMQALRDSLFKIADWGVGRLFYDPPDSGLSDRWVWARVNNIDAPEQRHLHTDLKQPVRLSFQVADPYWYSIGNQVLWDGTYTFNSAITWGGSGYTTITGSGTFTVTPGGSAHTLGRVEVLVSGAAAFNQLIVRRTRLGGVLDEIVLNKALVQNDLIEFDPRRQKALVNGVNVFSSTDFLHPDWMRLEIGSNTISVQLDNASAQVQVKVWYYRRYL